MTTEGVEDLPIPVFSCCGGRPSVSIFHHGGTNMGHTEPTQSLGVYNFVHSGRVCFTHNALGPWTILEIL